MALRRGPLPIFLFTGFLDSGKTKFIQDTLSTAEFVAERNTLLLICEQGEEEYDPSGFAASSVSLVTVENEKELTHSFMVKLLAQYSPDQIMIEYNGMWSLDTLYQSLPDSVAVAQEFAFFDSTTILVYNENMRTATVDKLRSCDLAIFNRMEHGQDVMPFHKLVRAVSRSCDIVYDYGDGVERDEIEDPLPFDKKAPIIEIADPDYALFYRDLGENLDQYNGKTVKLRVQIAFDDKLRAGEMLVGRKIMTCCIEDTVYSGLVAEYKAADFYREGEWLMLTAKISLKKHPLYQTRGPILAVTELARTDPPQIELTTFA